MRRNQSENEAKRMEQQEIAEAFYAWHRGDTLTTRQQELIEQARRETMIRALGLKV